MPAAPATTAPPPDISFPADFTANSKKISSSIDLSDSPCHFPPRFATSTPRHQHKPALQHLPPSSSFRHHHHHTIIIITSHRNGGVCFGGKTTTTEGGSFRVSHHAGWVWFDLAATLEGCSFGCGYLHKGVLLDSRRTLLRRGVCFDGGSHHTGLLWVAATALRGVCWLGFHQKGVCMVYSKRGCLVSGLAAVRGRLAFGEETPRGALVGAVTAQRAFGWVAATTQPPYGVRLV
ncbi:hypothetical protein Tco_1363212 [Tanacetum coccineum]